jgi:N-acyl-D-amino-acid deacylase
MLDILIKNAQIIDGSGEQAFQADVGIKEQRIVEITKKIEQEAKQSIQADNLCLAPGFIDPHMHSDLTLFKNSRAESSIRQGVTTEVIGNCGFSAAPLSLKTSNEVKFLAGGLDIATNWGSMAEYIERLEKSGSALNVVPMVGHNTIRSMVLGFEDVQPTSEQQLEMEQQVENAMLQGARGFSAGLFYPPGCYANTNEVIDLAKVAGKHGGIFACHIRSESDQVLSAVKEIIEIGEQAEIQVQFSHVKICGYRNWEMIGELIAMLESDEAREINLGCDQYPYTASSTTLYSILPYWAQTGGGEKIADRIKDSATRKRITKDWRENQIEWDQRSGVRDWSGILITECPSRPEFNGKTVEEIATQSGNDPFETALDIISLDNAQTVAVFHDQQEEILRELMQMPYVVVGSDSLGSAPDGRMDQGSPHPRTYGTFPRVLGRYVREEKVLSLETAIKKMTSVTAKRYNLKDRGVVRKGAWADLMIFDPEIITDKASFADPHQFPIGIPYVIVNGEMVIEEGDHTGKLPGRILKN